MTITRLQYVLAKFFRSKGFKVHRALPKRKEIVELIQLYEPGFFPSNVGERGRKNKKARLRYAYLVSFYAAHQEEIDAIDDGVPVPKAPKAERPQTKWQSWKERAKEFYASDQWRDLRYRVIAKRGARCECCGRTPREHGIVIHVDHIKPRWHFPELSLVESNLQVLCEDCNLGKGARDETDWRDPGQPLSDGSRA